MKYVKMLGIAAVAAMALMAIVGAGTASATKLCKNNLSTTACSEPYGLPLTIDATLKSAATLETTGGTVLDKCTSSTVKGPVTNAGSSTTTVSGDIEESGLTWGGCTVETKTTSGGTLEIHSIAGTDNGTLTATGEQVTVNTGFFGACVYGVGTGKDLGTVVGGKPASIVISTIVSLTKNESGLCPSETRWTAEYTVTEPEPLYISAG